jgi:hypothetical protein
VKRLAPLATLVVLLSGCANVSVGLYEDARSPACEHRGQPGTPMVVLEAQAVPTATLLPCVEALPAGWRVSDVFIHRGRARFTLDSDRAGSRAVTVVLERTCRVPRVTRVPSDEPGTRRFEEIGPVRPGLGFTGSRFYLFPGGCVTYRFQFKGEERAASLGAATLALSFIPREKIRELIRVTTEDRARLDSTQGG